MHSTPLPNQCQVRLHWYTDLKPALSRLRRRREAGRSHMKACSIMGSRFQQKPELNQSRASGWSLARALSGSATSLLYPSPLSMSSHLSYLCVRARAVPPLSSSLSLPISLPLPICLPPLGNSLCPRSSLPRPFCSIPVYKKDCIKITVYFIRSKLEQSRENR